MKELEEEFGKLSDSGPPAATRLLRSQQAVAAQATPTADTDDHEESSGTYNETWTGLYVTVCRWSCCYGNCTSN